MMFIAVDVGMLETVCTGDEIAGYQLRPLMNELIEGMLSIGSWLAPNHRSC